MLEIKNLHVSIEEKKIIKGLNLSINKGEVHALCLLYTSDAADE